MSQVPESLRYTPDHEWISDLGGGRLRVGVTDYAQSQLGDVVYVQLPEVGDHLGEGEACGEIESTKSVSDIYAPVEGDVVARNDALTDATEVVNVDPYGDGWMLEIQVDPATVADRLAELLDAQAYTELVTNG